MFGTRAAVLHGARLIGRRSLHRRWALAPTAGFASRGHPSSSSSSSSSCSSSTTRRGMGSGIGARQGGVPASFSAAAAVVPEAASTRGQGGRFPSLLITADAITAEGSFAETQATFMTPDQDAVVELDASLAAKNMGVVAHYYMDAELQGTLAALDWKHVSVADSLAMGDAAVKMVKEGGVTSIACLGVDFMAESVRATLDASGCQGVPVYRLSEAEIGCSLAEAAERNFYEAWLREAAAKPNSMHVVYINTSLVTKALSHSLVPTITCTSSNVLHTVLQAFSQVPDLTIWYGPDTYMGENIYNMLLEMRQMDDEQIRAVHPAHTQASIRDLCGRFNYFKQGNCVVHHMFGDDVVKRVRSNHADAFHTAHLEVPGEMFSLAMEAQKKGRGVVGSTSNILGFIKDQTREAVARDGGGRGGGEKLSFVLGTESGMITSIVRSVQEELKVQGNSTQVEIVFPVASEAMTATGEEGEGSMQVVPGVSGGEGCSTAGGCATCPFMKMNDLDALMDVASNADKSGAVSDELEGFLPKRRAFTLKGEDQTQLGVLPILHMRHLMANGSLSDELVSDVQNRCG
eukprot:jgi/Undpi1/10836/HiC_scaffold_3.g01365.m1